MVLLPHQEHQELGHQYLNNNKNMVNFNVPLPNPESNIDIGQIYQQAQQIKMNEAQLLAYQEQVRQRQLENERMMATQTLAQAAMAGDPKSFQQLSVIAPDAAKGIRDYNNYKLARTGQIYQSVITAPKNYRAKALENANSLYKKEFGEAPPVPGIGPDKSYSNEMQDYLKGLVTQTREIENVAKEEFEKPLQQQRVLSEIFRQQETKANTSRIYQETAKSKEELRLMQSEREAAENLGLTPTAYKSYQTNVGQNLADRTKPLSQESAKVLGLAQGGKDILGQIENEFFENGKFNKAKFGKTTAAANLPNVLAGETAQAFETRRQNLSDLIGRMRSGGAINKDEETRFLKLIPRFGDKGETVKLKLKQLNKEFSSIEKSIDPYQVRSQNNSISGGGGEDPLGIR